MRRVHMMFGFFLFGVWERSRFRTYELKKGEPRDTKEMALYVRLPALGVRRHGRSPAGKEVESYMYVCK